MSRLNPIGATTTSIPPAIRPAIEWSTWLCPAGARGKLSSSHSTTVVSAMIVPARFRKISVRDQRPRPTSRSRGIWYFGISIMKPDDSPFVTVRRSASAATKAPAIPIR